MLDFETLERIRPQRVGHAGDFGLHGCASRPAGQEPHLADGGMPSEASHPDGAAVLQVDHDSHAAIDDEVHGIGRAALTRDDVAGGEVVASAIVGQDLDEFGVAKRVGEPVVQRARTAAGVAMIGNDGVLAEFERAIDLRKD